jgi:hypothetical protein
LYEKLKKLNTQSKNILKTKISMVGKFADWLLDVLLISVSRPYENTLINCLKWKSKQPVHENKLLK